MLDEPTNHLDMHSSDLLVEALNKYEGSFILVSHDRYFISKTANKIWEIVDHEIKEFKGSYAEYVEWKERMAKQQAAEQKNNKPDKIKEQPVKNAEPVKPAPKETEKPRPQVINNDKKRDLQQLQ